MRSRTIRPLATAITLAVSSALLAGCFSADATFTINDDATTDIELVTQIDMSRLEEIAGLLGETLGPLGDLSSESLLDDLTGPDNLCGDLASAFTGYEVTTREINEDGIVGVGCTIAGVPIDAVSSLGDATTSISIEQDPQGTRFRAVVENVEELAGDPTQTQQTADMLGLDIDEVFSVRFTASAPGTLGENNASTVDGSTVSWEIATDAEFVTDGTATMTAEWSTKGSDTNGQTIWIVIVLAAIAIATVAAIALSRRSKRTRARIDAAAAAPTSPPEPVSAPPTSEPNAGSDTTPPVGGFAPPPPPSSPPPPPSSPPPPAPTPPVAPPPAPPQQ